jgi:malate dehydrogenase (oxaloacetate-decarboxylating)(NADP+)
MTKQNIDQEALDFHCKGKPGKIEINSTKPLVTQKELSLAYSPGVAVPCIKIKENPQDVYKYTSKGNLVAVVSNGTAVLGLGNLGALASKPVMEGKAVLFKRFADIDGFDIEVDTEDVDEFVNAIKIIAPTFGGINLEDIKAPSCFIIEDRLKKELDIPVLHDDQHGTAIVLIAGLINALHLTKRKFEKTKVVINGAGAAAIACGNLLLKMGVQAKNLLMADSKEIIHKERTDLNEWKKKFAVDTKLRTLDQAVKGADVLIGLSVKDAFTKAMVKSMNKKPIIFALANPYPEILPDDVKDIRSDAIIATGRSDYPNQVNNALCFPYIFRGALDVRATEINDAMKISAAQAMANLAREGVHEEVTAAYGGHEKSYGPEYIIPVPLDPRLISAIPVAVAAAAIKSGVAANKDKDLIAYEQELRSRRDITYSNLTSVCQEIKTLNKKVVFAEGEEEKMIRAAISFAGEGLGTAILIGQEDIIKEKIKERGFSLPKNVKIHNAKLSKYNEDYTRLLYKKLQRQGYLYRDCKRLINRDRNFFGAAMVAMGHADTMVTGLTRNYSAALDNISKVINRKEEDCIFGLSLLVSDKKAVFIADTTVNDMPTPEMLAKMACQSAKKAHQMGHIPRVAFVSYSNFGNPMRSHANHVREAVKILDSKKVNFEYEGDMSIDVALSDKCKELYPFSRLNGPANILIMPDLHSANISYKLLQCMGAATLIGPLLMGLEKPVQIANMTATANDLVNLAILSVNMDRK